VIDVSFSGLIHVVR